MAATIRHCRRRELARILAALLAVVGVLALALEPVIPDVHDNGSATTASIGAEGGSVPAPADHHATHIDHCVHAHGVVVSASEPLGGPGEGPAAPRAALSNALLSVAFAPPVRPPIV